MINWRKLLESCNCCLKKGNDMEFKVGDIVELTEDIGPGKKGNLAEIRMVSSLTETTKEKELIRYSFELILLKSSIKVSSYNTSKLIFKLVNEQKEPDFKIGDRVRVVQEDSDNFYTRLNGKVGVIVNMDDDTDYPYGIKFDDESIDFVYKIEKVEDEKPMHKFKVGDLVSFLGGFYPKGQKFTIKEFKAGEWFDTPGYITKCGEWVAEEDIKLVDDKGEAKDSLTERVEKLEEAVFDTKCKTDEPKETEADKNRDKHIVWDGMYRDKSGITLGIGFDTEAIVIPKEFLKTFITSMINQYKAITGEEYNV